MRIVAPTSSIAVTVVADRCSRPDPKTVYILLQVAGSCTARCRLYRSLAQALAAS